MACFITRCIGAASFAMALATWMLSPTPGFAQAFLPAKGEGSLGISFQDVEYQGHFRFDGSRRPAFQSRAKTMIFDVEYGLNNRLAVGVNLAYVNSKYTGKETPPTNIPRNVLDDGKYHGSPQDFRIELRYNALRRPLFVTPFLAAIVPSYGYDFIGEAAPGRHLRELVAGAYAGRLLNPLLPRAYLHGSYSYALVESDLGIRTNRSNVDMQFGYFVTQSASANFLWRRQWTHGGITFPEIATATPEVFANHDRLTRANYQHVGVGISYSISQSVDLVGSYVRFVSGTNEHYGRAFIVGLRWSFSARRKETIQPGAAAFGFAQGLP